MKFLADILSLLPSIGGLALLGSAVYIVIRSKTASVLRDERDAYLQKSERLQEELTTEKAASHQKDIVITDLQAKTDLTEITKAQIAILANQAEGRLLAARIETTLTQIGAAMAAMEKRLDRGLVMGQ